LQERTKGFFVLGHSTINVIELKFREYMQPPHKSSKYVSYPYKEISSEIWEQWHQCSESWQVALFSSAVWNRAIGDASENSHYNMYLMVAMLDERYVGFLPFRFEHVKSGRILPIRYCSPWSEWIPAWISVDPTLDRECREKLISDIYLQLPNWDKCKTGLILDNEPEYAAHEHFFQDSGIHRDKELVEMAEIKGFSTFEEFLQQQSSKWRAAYRKRSRQQFDSGNASLSHYTEFTEAQLFAAKERIMGIYTESWKRSNDSPTYNLLNAKPYREFSNLLDNYAVNDGLHIMFLTIQNDDAAFYVGVHSEGNYCSLQTAYKDKYRNQSIGYLAQMENFRYTIEHEFRSNNLLANQEYKTHFTDKVETYIFSICYNISAFGRTALFLSQAKNVCGKIEKYLGRKLKKT
jgi:hypothetical protein